MDKLDYIILLCNNLGNTRRFYEQILGLKLRKASENWIEFSVGDTALTLRKRSRPYDGKLDPETPGVQLAFNVGTTDEVDKWYGKLKSDKINIIEAPKNQDWGHRTLFFYDPEGNIIEIYCDI